MKHKKQHLYNEIENLKSSNNMWRGIAIGSLSFLGFLLFGLLLSPLFNFWSKYA